MPRTDACVFDTTLNGKTRREIMTTGIALALAAPLSLGSAAAIPADDETDWPEFQQWLKDAIALDDHYAESATIHDALQPWDKSSLKAREAYLMREDYQDGELDRLHDLALAMAARPIRTERQLAMLVALTVWAQDKAGGQRRPGEATYCFNVGRIEISRHSDDATCQRLIHALAWRAKQVMPELPFIFEAV